MTKATSFSEKEIRDLTRYIGDCKASGMPKDQIDLFVNGLYYPHHAQMKLHVAARQCEWSEVRYVLCGGSRGGGKTRAVTSQTGIDDCQRYPVLHVLFIRKVLKAAKRSYKDGF